MDKLRTSNVNTTVYNHIGWYLQCEEGLLYIYQSEQKLLTLTFFVF